MLPRGPGSCLCYVVLFHILCQMDWLARCAGHTPCEAACVLCATR